MRLFSRFFENRQKIRRLKIVIISIVVVIVCGLAYGASAYYQLNTFIKKAEQLSSQEKYTEAINQLSEAKNHWMARNIEIISEKISDEIEENSDLEINQNIYNQGVEAFENEKWEETINTLSQISEDSPFYARSVIKIEESKRRMLEGELVQARDAQMVAEQKAVSETTRRIQEQGARKEAEAQTQQEREGRQQAEAEAREEKEARQGVEAEERRMNADNDRDGLTYREELLRGTSDWNSDSDNDGIKDNLDSYPTGGGRYMPQVFSWSHGGLDWEWTENIAEDWYDYYKARPRGHHPSTEYITSSDPFIKKAADGIVQAANTKSNITKASLAIAFVQSLSYVDDIYTGYDDYPKYPVETFFEKNGDCEDTSYLAASIIDAANIAAVLITLPGHMAVGVWMNCDTSGTYYKFNDRCYYYAETTGTGWSIGEMPEQYENQRATLTKLRSNKTITAYPQHKVPCEPATYYPGYYYSQGKYYRDNQCATQTSCLPSTTYSGYYADGTRIYLDNYCTQLTECRPSGIYPGLYYDGSNWYEDRACQVPTTLF